MIRRRLPVVAIVLLLNAGHGVSAQSTAPGPRDRLEVAAGGGLFSGAKVADGNADLRANSLQPEAYRLFEAETRFAAVPTVEFRAGYGLTRRLAAEVRFAFNQPELRTSVTADVEGAPALTIVERVDQYVVDAGIVVMLDELRLGRVVPFAAAGAGYLRQLHEGATVVEEGHLYHVGGGLKHWFFTRASGSLRSAGLRADARLYLLARGIGNGGAARPHGAVTGSLFVTF